MEVDIWAMLQAPSFDCIHDWRQEQEEKLRAKVEQDQTITINHSQLMNSEQLATFVQHFQRITEHMLKEMPSRVDHCYQLNAARDIINEQHKGRE